MGLGGYLTMSPKPQQSAPTGSPAAPSPKPTAEHTHKSILPKDGPKKAPTPHKKVAIAPQGSSAQAMRQAEQPALSGIELQELTDADRQALKVPDRFGKGVVIRRVHPDSPAAEAGLRPNDVVVRAMRKNVDRLEDLTSEVADRDHTLLVASRDGNLMELVIQKPFKAAK